MNEDLKKGLVIFVFLILVVGLPLFFIFKKKKPAPVVVDVPVVENKSTEVKSDIENLIDASRLIGGLPTSDKKIGINFQGDETNALIEYISFLDFYEKIEDNFQANISSPSLPFNVKTEISNYYDISRKLNLDSHIDSLNNNGFAVLENSLDSDNFYDIYDELYKKQIPALITSDFLIYYYQYNLKKVFKDVEENLFYANLWEINRFLYEKAKIRYEDSLEAKGNVNDRILEAQRLAAAYFATSLELLKPVDSQINKKNDISNKSLFTSFEAESYSFSLPEYLEVDVKKEVDLIRKAQASAKSPVLLYVRNYKDFLIPSEYKSNAKLNNFYLTTKWLSSNFPLYYQSADCPQCSLDFDDWRINMITSTFIAKDIFDSYQLKNKWARIYKTLAFFKGLRGDLTYVHYRDALLNLFGEGYEIEVVFGDNNPEAINNLAKFIEKIKEYSFLGIEGGFDKNNLEKRPSLGVKMLTDFYWPNDYIFNQLSYPQVLEYQGASLTKNNITSCSIKNQASNIRCNGFSLDIVALVNEKSLLGNDYYFQNSNYKNYQSQINFLKDQINQIPNIWHYNNFWKTLNIIKEYLKSDKNERPFFTKNSDWRRQELYTAVGSWVDLQLPMDKLKIYQKNQPQSFVPDEALFVENNYIEPNLDLINEQIANVNMILEMFKLLKVTDELHSVLVNLEDLKNNLARVKEIMMKELSSENLSKDDYKFISLFSLEMKLEQTENKILKIEGFNKKTLNYDISKPKLMVLISNKGEKPAFSVGPVFNYKESR